MHSERIHEILKLCYNYCEEFPIFVSVEFAYITASRPRLAQLAAAGDPNALRANRLLNDTDRVLAVSQIGVTMASLGIGWVGESAAEQLIHRALTFIPSAWSNALAQTLGLVVAFASITALHIVLGEQAPKIVAIQSARLSQVGRPSNLTRVP